MINLKDIKNYNHNKKEGAKSALTSLIKSLNNAGQTPSNQGMNQEIDPRLIMPNLPNQSQDKNQDNSNQSRGQKQNSEETRSEKQKNDETNSSNKTSGKKSLEELKEIAKKIRDSAQDIIDDNDEEINKPSDSNSNSEELNKAVDKLEKTKDAANDLIKDINKNKESEKDDSKYKERLKKIADFWNDDNLKELEKEFKDKKISSDSLRKLKQELKDAKKNAVKKLNGYPLVNINVIRNNIYKTLKNSYTSQRNSDYEHHNPRNLPGGPLRPGRYTSQVYKKPKIGFFFDYSGSWRGNQEKINMGHRIAESLKDLDKKGIIDLTLYYFADTTDTDPNQVGGGNSNAPSTYIKELLDAKLIDNAIIMTDSDPECPMQLVLPGYVWLLFYDSITKSYIRNMKGRKGTTIYMIDHE